MFEIFQGAAIGFTGGCLSLFFLSKSITALLNGQTLRMGLFFMLQMAIIGVSLLVTAILRPGQLIYTGVGLVVPMVLGSVARVLIAQRKEARKSEALTGGKEEK